MVCVLIFGPMSTRNQQTQHNICACVKIGPNVSTHIILNGVPFRIYFFMPLPRRVALRHQAIWRSASTKCQRHKQTTTPACDQSFTAIHVVALPPSLTPRIPCENLTVKVTVYGAVVPQVGPRRNMHPITASSPRRNARPYTSPVSPRRSHLRDFSPRP